MKKIKITLGFILAHPLAKRHIFKALWRLVTWQIQSAYNPSRFFIKSFIPPVRFYVSKGLTGITGNIYAGLHEFNEMAFLLHFLRDEDTFIDVGANVGAYTILASGVCGATSIALEPVNSTFDILLKNVELNQLNGNVTAVNAAAGSEMGVTRFTSANDTTNHVVAENETITSENIEVKLLTIDSLIQKNIPQLAKIDVEGFESEVLKGMVNTLDADDLKAIIIELNGSGNRYGFNEADIHQNLLNKRFRPHLYDPFKRTLTETETFSTHNTIYCRDMEFVYHRIQTAAKISVLGEMI
ncbi:FkbM family methyltransferase [Mucilaginibacter panaciglaebae]|uniref:Methyltransferase FkbM domain-containing protein n=1 Tax=Mucilaginibacter panaciglaebae TaxID=502331 RepID=A0ABP7WAN1_9SPHI